MGEYLREVTDLLNYKNIVPTVELPGIPIPESDPVTRMSLLLPKSQSIDGKNMGIEIKKEIKVVRLPFEYDSALPKINPTTLNICMVSADGMVMGFKPSSDDLFWPTDESAFNRDLFIPNGEEQISIRAAVENNADNLIHDRFGLDPDEYSGTSDFRLFAGYIKTLNRYRIKDGLRLCLAKRRSLPSGGVEVFDRLVVGVDVVTKLGHKAIIDRLQSLSIESDLLPENIVVLNSQEIIETQIARESKIREIGHHGLLAGIDIIMVALKKI